MLNSKKNSGSVVVLAFVIAITFGFVVMAFYKVIDTRVRQSVYYATKKGAYELAIMGLNRGMGQLVQASNLASFNSLYNMDQPGEMWISIPELNGDYINQAAVVPADQTGGKPVNYYIKTKARVSRGANQFSTTLHSYVQLSNIGEYFAAVKGSLSISPGVNAAGGRIYADSLTFIVPGGGEPNTLVRGAEFFNTVTPNIVAGNWPVDLAKLMVNPTLPHGGFTVNDEIPPHWMPRKVPAPLIFPQVQNTDVAQYCADAPALNQCVPGPPGPPDENVLTITGLVSSLPNASTIICCNFNDGTPTKGIIQLRNVTVQGQVLFVSNGEIQIIGNLLKSGGLAAPQVANQAILMAQGDVVINNLSPVPDQPITQSIAAMVIAPNGAIKPLVYEPGDPHVFLNLNFTGSWVVAQVGDLPNTFANVYQGAVRQYNYDETLRTTPPPQLPAVSKIWFSFEEIGDSTGPRFN